MKSLGYINTSHRIPACFPLRWAVSSVGMAGLLACSQGDVRKAGPAPAISLFEAEQTQVEMGTEVVLTANFVNGKGEVKPQGGTLDKSGKTRVTPLVTTTYTMTVTSPSGAKIRGQTTIFVLPGISVQVDGHEGVDADITVSGPEGFKTNLIASDKLTNLKPGFYSIYSAPVRKDDLTLHPLRPVQEVTVSTGTILHISYLQPSISVPLPGQIPLKMTLIPAGTFKMGDDHPVDARHFPNPSPSHQVTLQEAFYLATFPTTLGQWEAVLGPGNRGNLCPDCAVDNVSFDDITNAFLPALNQQAKSLRFRLPSEAEWEYACRAGTATTFFHGEDPSRASEYSWSIEAYQRNDHPVGRNKPNPWGLFDMSGLVFQWCEDLSHDGYQGAPSDGTPWLEPGIKAKEGNQRIIRGYPPLPRMNENHWGSSPDRHARFQGDRFDNLGFRIAATVVSPNSD